MKILIAPASFKGSLRAIETAEIISKAVHEAMPGVKTLKAPLADGGEGTLEILIQQMGGKLFSSKVTDPLGRRIKAKYGILADEKTAVIEMAQASGLQLLNARERNPLKTTTYGTGELIKNALDHGVKRILIGLGGSATVDGGAGMAQALGAKLLDKRGQQIGFGGVQLSKIETIDPSHMDARLTHTKFIALCDVQSPLLGPQGARLYMPQKGATPKITKALEKNLAHFARKVEKYLGKRVENLPGAGAAGGLGSGLAAFLNAELRSGIEFILDALKFEEKLKSCDLIISGEGRVDAQTAQGKVIAGIAQLAKRHRKPLIIITGAKQGDLSKLYELGVAAVLSIMPSPMSEQEAMKNAKRFLREAVQELGKLLALSLRE